MADKGATVVITFRNLMSNQAAMARIKWGLDERAEVTIYPDSEADEDDCQPFKLTPVTSEEDI
jgi:hypothetical protein